MVGNICNVGKGQNVKNNILPHSKAKLDLYKSYLNEYLPILGLSPYIDEVNIFDIFCGTGVYDDGNIGSPLIAANCIIEFQEYCKKYNKVPKKIKLFINDFDAGKISKVDTLIKELDISNCAVTPYNLDAIEMFKVVSDKVNSFPKSQRNLIFVDPYGYSKIEKDLLYQILKGKRSEVILFLPVAHMKRFTEEALTVYDRKDYENLRRFILEFFPQHSIVLTEEKVTIFEYIEELRNALSFNNEFYTASHYIQRDKSNYYALFFIGHHILGLEKFIEAKWRNDTLGRGFNQQTIAPLFSDMMEEYDKALSMNNLKKITKSIFDDKEVLSNKDLYEFVLNAQFKPTHMNQLLREWIKDRVVSIVDSSNEVIETTGSFYIDYKSYKLENPKLYFKKK